MGKLSEKLRRIPWKKLGLGLIVFGLMMLSFIGGHLLANWYFRAQEFGSALGQKYADWRVYKLCLLGAAQAEPSESESCLGLRYPDGWEVNEVSPLLIVFRPESGLEEGEDEEGLPKEHISLVTTPSGNRGKTACEEDQNQCSFHANGIFGDRVTTPETETIFSAHGADDFTFTLYRYDVSDEVWESYVAIFEEMGASLRFISQAAISCEEDADCALGIRLDECCSCPKAFATSEIETNSTIAAYEVGKDYLSEKTIDCSSVYCSLCPDPDPAGAVCISSRCQIKE